ncbi:MAG: hypothetical protein K0S47_110 [Herbinix sp.]|jgi:predicted nucleotidyltransferase|nr:hypothetical protein [Herbinix sp.]
MRTYEAIDIISKTIIADGLCEAILMKGSIGRGDDDAYSDVDMYAVVKKDVMELFLEKRITYLNSYLPTLYLEHVNFVGEQIVAIFQNGLHFDLYAVTEETLPHTDQAKIIYDPNHKYDDYIAEVKTLSIDQLAGYFNDALYYFIEADGAYNRKNYPWASMIMSSSIAESAILLRYLYDKDYAYLGLKKINEIIPTEQFSWLSEASANMNKEGFLVGTNYIIKILDYVVQHIDNDIRSRLNLTFFQWIKANLGSSLFVLE